MPVFENNRPLLDAFREGRPEALEKVYYAYFDQIERLVRMGFTMGTGTRTRILGVTNPDEKRDIIQEVFTRAFSLPARMAFDGLRPYKPYIFRIAKNLLVDRLRKKNKDFVLDPKSFPEDEGPEGRGDANLEPAVDPEDALHLQRLMKATREYVSTLSDELKLFIRLRFEEELSQREVSEKMNITRRRVRTLETKAQSGLKAYLHKQRLIER